MQANPRKQQVKTKYVQPPIFNVSGSMRPNNPNHCRSLIDLNTIDGSSAQKQNRNNLDHYSSVISNHERDNKAVSSNKFNTISNSGSAGHTLANHKNISNIAKILLNANTAKSKQSHQDIYKNNSFTKVTNQNTNLNIGNKNKYGYSNTRKNQAANYQQLKTEARTSSQTHLRDITTQNNNKSHLFHQQCQSSLQRERSQKSIKKQTKKLLQAQHIQVQKQKQNNHRRERERQNRESEDYNLIIKLKQYIQNLKQKEQDHIQKIHQLSREVHILKDESVLLKDKVQVYQIREKEMISKIKNLQNQINSKNSEKHYSNNSHSSKSQCHEHQLIIQSLKNVINEQMNKIIELETYKVQIQQSKQRNSYSKHKKERENQMKSMAESYKDNQNQQLSQRSRIQYQQVYSFKKKNNLNQSSIYIEDEVDDYIQPRTNQAKNQQYRKQKNSYSSIPQPYNELIKSLKSDSRMRNKNVTQRQQEGMQQIQIDNEICRQSSYSHTESQNEVMQSEQQDGKQKTQCSQDQILQQVGQYLSFIRKNVKNS